MKLVIKISKNSAQQGFVLIIAMVLMVVMAFSAIAAVRVSGVDSLANENARTRAQAMQAAKTAVAFCKSEVFSNGPGLNIIEDSGNEGFEWKKAATWAEATKVNKLTQEKAFSDLQVSEIATTIRLPECVIENVTEFVQENSDKDQKIVAYKITARGYSPNYTADNTTGITTSGSQVWLQVVIARMAG